MFTQAAATHARHRGDAMSTRLATAVLAATSLLAAAGRAYAQDPAPTPATTTPGFELLIPSGRVVPTGSLEKEVDRGRMTAVQLSYGLRPDLVVTSTVGWTRTTPRQLGPDASLHRDFLTWGRPFGAARSTGLNDVAVLAGLRLALR